MSEQEVNKISSFIQEIIDDVRYISDKQKYERLLERKTEVEQEIVKGQHYLNQLRIKEQQLTSLLKEVDHRINSKFFKDGTNISHKN